MKGMMTAMGRIVREMVMLEIVIVLWLRINQTKKEKILFRWKNQKVVPGRQQIKIILVIKEITSISKKTLEIKGKLAIMIETHKPIKS